jgi:N-acetylglucosamine-6-phosphate deacetylase
MTARAPPSPGAYVSLIERCILRFVRIGVEAALVDGALVRGDVSVAAGRIEAVGLSGGGRGIAVPGFVDLHVHGFGGVDFATADAAGYRRAGEALLATGVTAFQPSFVTAPVDELIDSLRAVPGSDIGPRVLGCHLEGPFISPVRLGMHPADAQLDPDPAILERLLAAGPVSHMTFAPELPGAGELLATLIARGIVAACGHTDADAVEAEAAFDTGATHVTHLFNAMRPFGHRAPALVGVALVREDVTVELILDGNHVADETVGLAWRAAAGRVVLVTDAIAAAGVGDGAWHLGAVPVDVREGVVRRIDGALAGSVLTLPEAIRHLMAAGARFEEAVGAATAVPARAARRTDIGILRPGAPADVVVLEGDVQVTRVLVGGEEP